MSSDVPELGSRTLFPHLKAKSYLNHAAISPPSLAVESALAGTARRYAELGVAAFPIYMEQRERLRGKLAGLIGSSPEEIGYVANTTSGVIHIASCMRWRKGDRILLTEGEFPANVTPWMQAASLHGLSAVFLPSPASGDHWLAALEKELVKGARLVALSAVQFQTGLRMPLLEAGRLCRKHGALLFVDAIQGCGSVPLNVGEAGIDFLSCGSHKWLMGLEGCGFLYIRSGRMEQLAPRTAGWLSHKDGLAFLFEGEGHLVYGRPIKETAGFVEGGAYNAAGFAALEASLDILQMLGIDSIYSHVNRYIDSLEHGLEELGFRSARSASVEGRSCSLSLKPPIDCDLVRLAEGLEEAGISCSMPDGWLRFSPHWPNSHGEIPMVLEAVRTLL